LRFCKGLAITKRQKKAGQAFGRRDLGGGGGVFKRKVGKGSGQGELILWAKPEYYS